jgi:hypothetical protein
MFGEGIFNFSDFIFCMGACFCSPIFFGMALALSIFMPSLRGIAFGLAFGITTYLFFGFLFGDTVGLVLGAIVFFMTAINQRFITISSKRIKGASKIYSPIRVSRSEKSAPRIEIIPPANWRDDD